jgi:hypothetical protein
LQLVLAAEIETPLSQCNAQHRIHPQRRSGQPAKPSMICNPTCTNPGFVHQYAPTERITQLSHPNPRIVTRDRVPFGR